MEFKHRVERHPIIYLLVSAVSVSTIAVGVAEYFCRQRIDIANQKSELRISTLESELTSIRRGIGESKFLDIRSFVYPKDRLSLLRASPKAKYIAADGFYAILDLPGWKYKANSFRAFMVEDGEKMSPAMDKLLGGNRTYMWEANEDITVKGPRHFSDSGPVIFMQKIPVGIPAGVNKEDLSKAMNEIYGSDLKPTDVPDIAPGGKLERFRAGDIATFQLGTFMQSNFREFIGSPEVNSQLIELEKVSNVVYAQVLITVRNATVNGKKLPVYFVREEEILVADQDALTSILITVPSADPAPRGQVYSQIQEWFSGLAIFVSEGAD